MLALCWLPACIGVQGQGLPATVGAVSGQPDHACCCSAGGTAVQQQQAPDAAAEAARQGEEKQTKRTDRIAKDASTVSCLVWFKLMDPHSVKPSVSNCVFLIKWMLDHGVLLRTNFRWFAAAPSIVL